MPSTENRAILKKLQKGSIQIIYNVIILGNILNVDYLKALSYAQETEIQLGIIEKLAFPQVLLSYFILLLDVDEINHIPMITSLLLLLSLPSD